VAQPLVTCITPTYNRVGFLQRAIAAFHSQDWRRKELLIDDSPIRHPVLVDEGVRYYGEDRRMTTGEKRNLACALALGEIIVQWDDDDWHGPGRISYQAEPLIAEMAEITGLDVPLIFELPTRRFFQYQGSPDGLLYRGVLCGTLAYLRTVWELSGGYPNQSIGEDVAVLERAIASGARLLPLKNSGTFIYVRHQENTWSFMESGFVRDGQWVEVDTPEFVPLRDDMLR
jgi:glycosyltransferase involved in cell wall biosynthesis